MASRLMLARAAFGGVGSFGGGTSSKEDGGNKSNNKTDDAKNKNNKDNNDTNNKNDEQNNDEENASDEEDQQEDENDEDVRENRDEVGDTDQFSQEAKTWANNMRLKPQMAQFYEYGKDRSRQDVEELSRKRKWRVKLRNLKFTNHGELGDYFVVFNVGWNFKLKTKKVRVKTPGGAVEQARKNRSKSGKRSKNRSSSNTRNVWVPQGSRGVIRLSDVKRNVAKGKTVEFASMFEFEWSGSYFDLYDKDLHVEVWEWNEFLANRFKAHNNIKLKTVASGSMNLSFDLERRERKRGVTGVVTVGELQAQCVLQEICKYQIKLSNWSVSINPFYALERPREWEQRELLAFATFRLIAGPGQSLASAVVHIGQGRTKSLASKITLKNSTEMCNTDLRDLGMLIFQGTRLELEDSLLLVDIFDKGLFRTSSSSVLLGSARISLKSVVQNGYLSADLAYQGPRSLVTAIFGHSINVVKTSVQPYTSKVVRAVSSALEAGVQGTSSATAAVGLDFMGGFGTTDETITNELIESSEDEFRRVGLVTGNMDVECEVARLWREFAQVGELQPPELRDYPPYKYSYLGVRVIAARDLLGVDISGLSDPYVMVEWGGQRQSTKIVSENLNPLFEEMLYFHVRSFNAKRVRQQDLISHPFIRFTVWDYNEAGSSDFLGTTKIYLHQVTGCPRDEHIPPQKTRQIPVLRRRRRRGRLYQDVIHSRVFKDDRKLHGLQTGIDSFLKIEVFFRSPDGDLLEPDALAKQRNGTHMMLLPNVERIERLARTPCICFPPVSRDILANASGNFVGGRHGNDSIGGGNASVSGSSVSGSTTGKLTNRTDGGPVITGLNLCNESMSTGSRCRTISRLEEELRKFYPDAQKRFHMIGEELGMRNLRCMNQFEEAYFLPTFLQPMTPPRALLDPSEHEYMLFISSQKPNSSYAVAQLVRSFEFEIFDETQRSATKFNEHTWISPDFFLAMRKGDTKAHALLLCNAFLGLMTDAYVCLGYAYVQPRAQQVRRIVDSGRQRGLSEGDIQKEVEECRRRKRPHVWVMTRESDSACCGPAFGNRLTHGGAVKFWEASLGAYYPPLPNRWSGRDDVESMNTARGDPKREKRDHNNHGRRDKHDDDADGTLDFGGGQNGLGEFEDDDCRDFDAELYHDNTPMVELSEEDMIDEEFAMWDEEVDMHDVIQASEEINSCNFNDMVGINNSPGGVRKRVESGGGLSSNDIEFVDSPTRNNGSPSRSSVRNPIKTRQDDSANAIGTGSISGDIGILTPEQETRMSYITHYNRCVHLLVKSQRKQFRRANLNRNGVIQPNESLRQGMPYCELTAVFNHTNMWVNVQETCDPRKMTFDFEESETSQTGAATGGNAAAANAINVTHEPAEHTGATGWVSVLSPDQVEKNVFRPHYAARNFGPAMSKEAVSELERRALDELKTGVENFRAAHDVETRWSDEQMSRLLAGVLASRYALDRLDKIAENGWDVVNRQWTGDGKDGVIATVGYTRYSEYLQRLRTVHASPPSGFVYRLQITSVNNCDPKEIRKVVLRMKPLRGRRGSHACDRGDRVEGNEQVRVHEEYHDGREMFAVGVHVEPLNNQLASVLVGLMVVYPDPDAGRGGGNDVNGVGGDEEVGGDDDDAVMAA